MTIEELYNRIDNVNEMNTYVYKYITDRLKLYIKDNFDANKTFENYCDEFKDKLEIYLYDSFRK
jgi:hypothetical protein